MRPRADARVGSGTRISPVPRLERVDHAGHSRSSPSRGSGRSSCRWRCPPPSGASMSVLPGASWRIRWKMPLSVATMYSAASPSTTALRSWDCRADDVGLGDDARRRLGVDEDERPGCSRAEELELDPLELLVDDAGAVPRQHVGAGLAGDVVAEVAVGRPQDLLAPLGEVAHDRQRAGAGDDPVGPRLHGGARVRVDDDRPVGVRVAEGGELIRRAADVERARRVEVGREDALLGAQDLRRLAHEADAGDDERLAGWSRPKRAISSESATQPPVSRARSWRSPST